MASDLKIIIDGVRLNVRVGVILKHKNKILIELSKVGLNSVIPGGRIKINENSISALMREIKEEIGITLVSEKFKKLDVFENFYTIGDQPSHEIYFLYEYNLTDKEALGLNSKQNMDSKTTYFEFVEIDELEKYNLQPTTLYSFIKK